MARRRGAPESATNWAAVADALSDAVLVVNPQQEILSANLAAKRLLQWNDLPTDRQLTAWCGPLNSELASPPVEECRTILRDAGGHDLPMRLRFQALGPPDGLVLVLLSPVSPVDVPTAVLSSQDLGGRLLTQAALLTATADSFDDAVRRCLGVVCDATSWSVAHAWLPSSDQRELQSSGVWHPDELNGYSLLRECSRDLRLSRGDGLVGRAWQSRAACWRNEIENDLQFQNRDTQLPFPVRAAIALPIIADRDVIAVLEFFSDGDLPHEPALLPLIASVCDQLGRLFERKKWDQERARSAAIVECTSDAVIARDLQGRITQWNPGAEQIYGYSAVEAIGQPATLIIPHPLGASEPEIQEVVQFRRRLEHLETIRRRKDGALIDVSVTVSPLLDASGELIGTATIERDITRTKQRELDLRRAMHAAEAAQRTQQQFLANVSHELRTPMNAIIGMVDLSLGEVLPVHVRDYLETARDSSRLMLALVDDLLDYSRIEAGRFELETDPFSIRRTLDSAMRALSVRAVEQGLELLCTVSPNVPDRLIGDSRRLRQVVSNLTGNAIKFSDQGEVVVQVDVAHEDQDSVLLALHVRDTGIGISPSDQNRIFQAFTQADATSTRRHSGVGLGLTITREIVEQMGGTLNVASDPGQGSIFTATMRFRVLSRRREVAGDAPQQLSAMPVLVVDDNATNRRILEETLKNWSMRPKLAPGATAALEIAEDARRRGEKFPILIVDGAMPEMDGCTLVETLKARGLLGEARILMLSSGGPRSSDQRIADLPIAAFLEKPVSQSMLLDAIMTAIGGSPHQRHDVIGIQRTTHPLSILVAEDTAANRKVIDAILDRRGHRRELVANGQQAVERVRTTHYDAILMDVQMPVMDGLQATAEIRHLENGRNLPIIAMTAHAMRGDRERCLQAGMNAYVPKPIVAGDLLQVLEQTVSHARRSHPEFHRSSDAGTPMPSPSPSVESTSAPSEPVLNLTIARQRLGGDEQLLKDLASFFLEDGPALLDELRSHLASNNLDEASRAAHSVKGLAANFDAASATRVAQAIEDAARAGDGAAAAKEVDSLAAEVGRVVAALKREVL